MHSSLPDLSAAVARVKSRVLPLFVVMFIVNYLDRVNVGFIQQHLKTDLGLDSAAFGLGAGLFFVGYAIFEVPSNMLLEKVGARLWLTRITVSWGLVASLMAFAQNATQFYLLRFALGAAEAGFFPGVIYYFTRWLPAADRGKAIALFLSGSAIASILSGPLSGFLVQFPAFGLKGWQSMLVIEGLFSVLIGSAAWFWLDSKPADARWLTPGQKRAIEDTLAEEQRAREATQSERPSAWRLVRDPQILLFCVIYFAIQLTIYAATFWLPSIIRKMGNLSEIQVGFLNSVPWAISILGMVGFASAANRWKNQQAWVSAALIIAAAGMFLSTTAGPLFAFVAICCAALGFKSAASLFWPIPQGYLDARIAAAVIALINSLGNLGGFVAPTVFGYLEKRTGSVRYGLYGLALSSVLTAGLLFFVRTKPRSH
jgi:sugar phosphate permease